MDTIADFLTQIRNALRAGLKTVSVPSSKMKYEICRVLLEEGYISNFEVKEERFPRLLIQLKYDNLGQPVIRELARVSRPSRRRYVATDSLPRVLGGLGVAILSTSKGILTDRDARREQVGGEVLLYVH